jgi:hypothetical protein
VVPVAVAVLTKTSSIRWTRICQPAVEVIDDATDMEGLGLVVEFLDCSGWRFCRIDEGPLGSCLNQKIYAQKDNLSHLLLKS